MAHGFLLAAAAVLIGTLAASIYVVYNSGNSSNQHKYFDTEFVPSYDMPRRRKKKERENSMTCRSPSEVSEEKEHCTICLDPLELSGVEVIHLHCQHSFHRICLDGWMDEKKECPVCRRSVLLL